MGGWWASLCSWSVRWTGGRSESRHLRVALFGDYCLLVLEAVYISTQSPFANQDTSHRLWNQTSLEQSCTCMPSTRLRRGPTCDTSQHVLARVLRVPRLVMGAGIDAGIARSRPPTRRPPRLSRHTATTRQATRACEASRSR